MEEVHCMASIGDNFDLNDLVISKKKENTSDSEFEYAYCWSYRKVSSFLPSGILGEHYQNELKLVHTWYEYIILLSSSRLFHSVFVHEFLHLDSAVYEH